jgi:hypothetical protein
MDLQTTLNRIWEQSALELAAFLLALLWALLRLLLITVRRKEDQLRVSLGRRNEIIIRRKGDLKAARRGKAINTPVGEGSITPKKDSPISSSKGEKPDL